MNNRKPASRWIRLADTVVFAAVELWGRYRYRKRFRKYRKLARGTGTRPRLAVPRSANDKFLWRKVFDHDPRFVAICGKLGCREWVRVRDPDLAMAELLWVGVSAADIPDAILRRDVVIKPNAASGRYRFIRDGEYDRHELEHTARDWLAERYDRRYGEWGYRDAPDLLLVESEIRPDNGVLDELKIYTFGERIERVVYIRARFGNMEAAIWEPDADGRLVRSEMPAAVAERPCPHPLPDSVDRALEHARILGREFDHLRVDLYTDGDNLWFGELTVYNQAGEISHVGTDPDSRITRVWDIRRSRFLRHPPSRGWRAWYAAALSRRLRQATPSENTDKS